MKNRKAPGPDGIPVEALKIVADSNPSLLLGMFNACLKAGIFPAKWKIARLTLISKGKGDPESPSAYRPLCMLDTAGKVLEKLLRQRLQLAIQEAGGLSNRQHGFRKSHSAVNAVAEVVDAFERAQEACHQARPVVLLVTLDVKNAFNSVRWTDIIEALEKTFKVSGYLLNMLKDYLSNRSLVYDTKFGQKEKKITAGVAQGSILGPDLWNVTYDSLLRLEMPDETFLVGYADDVAAVITARSKELAQLKLNQVMRRVERWMAEHGLQLAIAKTEIVMLTKRRIPTIVPMTVGTEELTTSEAARYLGVTFDPKLTFWTHIRKACEKAETVSALLARLMANMGGPKQSTRVLLMSTVTSILLYGAEVWADKLLLKKYRKRMAAVQRKGALRIACSYRTVSETAVMVVAGVIPIDLLALERRDIFRRSLEIGREEASAQARIATMQAWQRRWDGTTVGKWTSRLVKNLAPWAERAHGEVNFYTTQFLTGHGYFGAYLYRRKLINSPCCRYCSAESDDADHTFFKCDQFAGLRGKLYDQIGVMTPDTVIDAMLSSMDGWSAVATYVETILRRKKEDGCLTSA